jgi:hypothetical protein
MPGGAAPLAGQRPARSIAPGQTARKRLLSGVNGIEERVEKPSSRGLVPGRGIEQRKILVPKRDLRLHGRGVRPIRCAKFLSATLGGFVL